MSDGTCSIDGCDNPARSRGWCKKHYAQWRRTGDPTAVRKRGPKPIPKEDRPVPPPCAVDGCDRPSKTRGYCHTHYERLRTTGDVGSAKIRVRSEAPKECAVDGCNSQSRKRNWCNKHYIRWQTHGDPEYLLPPLTGFANPSWKADEIGYTGAHRRVSRLRGKATQYQCIDCGDQACDWSYDNSDPNELIGTGPWKGIAYSTDPSRYAPRCRPCHSKYDTAYGRRLYDPDPVPGHV